MQKTNSSYEGKAEARKLEGPHRQKELTRVLGFPREPGTNHLLITITIPIAILGVPILISVVLPLVALAMISACQG